MTVAITNVTVDLGRAHELIANLPGIVDRATGRAAVVFQGAAIQALGGGGRVNPNRTGTRGIVNNTPSLPGNFPQRQTGQLMNSVVSERQVQSFYLVGTNLAHGKYMEFGAHPRAKKGRYLTVPMNYEAKRMLARAGGTVRNIPGLQIIAKTKRGWLMGFKEGTSRIVRGRTAVRRKTKALFALVPDVVILPRPWLLPTATNTGNQRAAVAAFRATIFDHLRGKPLSTAEAAD